MQLEKTINDPYATVMPGVSDMPEILAREAALDEEMKTAGWNSLYPNFWIYGYNNITGEECVAMSVSTVV